MGLRCAAARVPNIRNEFLADAARVKQNAGGYLTVAEVEEVKEHTVNIAPGGPSEHELRLRLALPNGPSSVIRFATITEGGEPKLCGATIEESFPLRQRLAGTQVPGRSGRISDLKALSESVGPTLNVKFKEDQATTGQGGTGLEGWTTAWQVGSYGGGRVVAVRYGSTFDARAAAVRLLTYYSADGVATFASAVLPDAVGQRYLGLPFTWVQPADLAPVADMMLSVYGDVMVVVFMAGLEPRADHSALDTVLQALRPQLPG